MWLNTTMKGQDTDTVAKPDKCWQHLLSFYEEKIWEKSRMGHTLTLDVPEDVYQSLIQRAEQTGQMPEAVAVQLLATATQHRTDDPLEQFIGAFRSHGANWADQHDASLGISFARS